MLAPSPPPETHSARRGSLHLQSASTNRWTFACSSAIFRAPCTKQHSSTCTLHEACAGWQAPHPPSIAYRSPSITSQLELVFLQFTASFRKDGATFVGLFPWKTIVFMSVTSFDGVTSSRPCFRCTNTTCRVASLLCLIKPKRHKCFTLIPLANLHRPFSALVGARALSGVGRVATEHRAFCIKYNNRTDPENGVADVVICHQVQLVSHVLAISLTQQSVMGTRLTSLAACIRKSRGKRQLTRRPTNTNVQISAECHRMEPAHHAPKSNIHCCVVR